MIRTLDFLVSLFIFIIILFLITHMGLKMWDLGGGLWENIQCQTCSDTQILHGIAHAIVLVKAYKILMSYLKTHHVNIKYLVEIAIIAAAVEIIFNSTSHTLQMNLVFGAFGVLNLGLYLFFYEKFKEMGQEKEASFSICKMWGGSN